VPAPHAARVLPSWLPALVLALTAAVLYAGALGGPFLLDDQASIEENSSIRRLWPPAAALSPPPNTPVAARPLVNVSFAVSYATGGLRPEHHRVWNLGLHALTALTLFGVLRRSFARASPPLSALATPAALACALLWLVHPLNTEVVNYATQRTESMMALFYLLGLYASIRAVDAGRGRWQAAAIVSALCAVASKESAITLPIVVALWDRAFAFRTFGESWRARRALYAGLGTSWLLFAGLARDLPIERSIRLETDGSRWTYLLNQAEIVPRYLGLAVWPHPLVFDYGPMRDLSIGDVLPGLALMVALLALACAAWIRRPSIGFWAAWFFVTLAPASSLVPIQTEVGAERRMYLPLAGTIALIVSAAIAALDRVPTTSVLRRWLPAVLLAGAAVGLSAVTVTRNRDYRSDVAIWQTVVERRPHARAREHLSVALRDAGRRDEAIAQLRLAAPESANAKRALAAALFERGDVTEALSHFREFVDAYPDDPDIAGARREYARALRGSGDLPASIAQLRMAIAAAPDDVRSRVDLGDALRESGDVRGALAEYREAERLQPDNVVVLSSLGVLLASNGLNVDALPRLRRAVEIDPRLAAPRVQLIQLHLIAGRFRQAEADARALLTFHPALAEGHNLLGVALANQQRFDAARQEFMEALRIDPDHRDAQRNMARIDAMRAPTP
jgi:tetratricopeptide (TPR) repeat protein